MAKETGKKSLLDFFKVKDIDEDDEFDDDLFDDDDEYEDDDYDDYDDDYVKPAKKKQSARVPANASASTQTAATRQSYSAVKPSPQNNGKLVNFNNAKQEAVSRPEYRGRGNNEVYVIKPQETDEAQSIIDYLTQRKTIVINIEGLELSVAQRIIDYIGGACYAMGGSLSAVSANIFIATPHEVEVSGDLRDEIVSQDSLTPYMQY